MGKWVTVGAGPFGGGKRVWVDVDGDPPPPRVSGSRGQPGDRSRSTTESAFRPTRQTHTENVATGVETARQTGLNIDRYLPVIAEQQGLTSRDQNNFDQRSDQDFRSAEAEKERQAREAEAERQRAFAEEQARREREAREAENEADRRFRDEQARVAAEEEQARLDDQQEFLSEQNRLNRENEVNLQNSINESRLEIARLEDENADADRQLRRYVAQQEFGLRSRELDIKVRQLQQEKELRTMELTIRKDELASLERQRVYERASRDAELATDPAGVLSLLYRAGGEGAPREQIAGILQNLPAVQDLLAGRAGPEFGLPEQLGGQSPRGDMLAKPPARGLPSIDVAFAPGTQQPAGQPGQGQPEGQTPDMVNAGVPSSGTKGTFGVDVATRLNENQWRGLGPLGRQFYPQLVQAETGERADDFVARTERSFIPTRSPLRYF